MKRRFVMQDNKNKDIVFSAGVDADGDFNVMANGINILWIDAVSGDLWRCVVGKDNADKLNLSFNDDYKIELEVP